MPTRRFFLSFFPPFRSSSTSPKHGRADTFRLEADVLSLSKAKRRAFCSPVPPSRGRFRPHERRRSDSFEEKRALHLRRRWRREASSQTTATTATTTTTKRLLLLLTEAPPACEQRLEASRLAASSSRALREGERKKEEGEQKHERAGNTEKKKTGE